MRNKRVIYTAIIMSLIIISTFIFSRQNNIEEAIRESSQYDVDILYIDKNEDENFLIYQHKGMDDLSFAILKKSFGKYKIYYNGTIGEIKESKQKAPILYNYVPKVKNVSNAYYFGIVNNDDIKQIQVFDENEDCVKAQIINTAIGRIWIANINELNQKGDYKIRCLSSTNGEIEVLIDKISTN